MVTCFPEVSDNRVCEAYIVVKVQVYSCRRFYCSTSGGTSCFMSHSVTQTPLLPSTTASMFHSSCYVQHCTCNILLSIPCILKKPQCAFLQIPGSPVLREHCTFSRNFPSVLCTMLPSSVSLLERKRQSRWFAAPVYQPSQSAP